MNVQIDASGFEANIRGKSSPHFVPLESPSVKQELDILAHVLVSGAGMG